MTAISRFILLIIIAGNCSTVSYAIEKDRIAGFSIQPAFVPLGLLDLQITVKIKDDMAIILPLSGAYLWPLQGLTKNEDFWGVAGGLGIRWTMWSKIHQDGWFIQPLLRAGFLELGKDYKGSIVIPCAEMGYGWYFENRLSLSLAIGAHLVVTPQGFGPDRSILLANYPLPLINFSIGYV